MKLESKYAPGDEVVFMYDNRPRWDRVKKVTVIVDFNGKIYKKYDLESISMTYAENDLCKTLKELKEKVFGE